MKIAWFTPFNVESAIGRYSKFAVEALSAYVDVDIFISKVNRMHETECKIVKYTQENVGELIRNYDMAVYNMGDNSMYHAEIYEVAQQYPGVIINHDICLHNFMRGYYLEYKKDYSQFKIRLEEEFGLDQAEMLWDAGMQPEEFIKIDFLKYNFSKHIADNAFGVIVHSKYHERFMKDYFKGPMKVITMLDMSDNLDKLDESICFNGYEKDKIHILTVGNLNENKRIHSIICVLGEYPELAKKIDYTIVGAKGNKFYSEYLNGLIKKYKLEDIVHMTGFVTHKELAYYYQGADIVSNLRYPAYEGASGSIVEQLSIGKCCMVSNTGVYSEIDDYCVIKVSLESELNDIRNILENILDGSINIDEIGKNAKDYAKRVLDRDLYAQNVLLFFKEVIFQRPLHVLKDQCIEAMENIPLVIQRDLVKSLATEITQMYNII